MKLGLFLFVPLALILSVFSCTSPPQQMEPLSDEEAQRLELGEDVYNIHCRPCHMPKGKSPIKRLRFADGEWRNGSRIEDIQKVINEGVAATQMLPFNEKLSPQEIDNVSRYVKSLATERR